MDTKTRFYFAGVIILAMFIFPIRSFAAYHFSDFKARPPIHYFGGAQSLPHGLTPDQIKSAYRLPKKGGMGTIAIIGAYDDKNIERDLEVFSKQFNLPECTTKNGCFEKHLTNTDIKTDSGWAGETSLDVEWSHAIAPNAKILLVAAKTPSGANLLKAVDYARSRKDVVAISMSWGGQEFPDEITLDEHFKSKYGATFFASSGDNGAGASWPAASSNVIAVGGTRLLLNQSGNVSSEVAWQGSGGGVSAYEPEPDYQKSYSIKRASGKRAVPDVSYDADPQSGFSVYISKENSVSGSWYVVGGTSAGAPQWAAIKALGGNASNEKFYADKAGDNNASFFRDIKSGTNGDCGYFCNARAHYDYVTGLGSPLTAKF